jgi:hypothetical protein
MLCTAGNIYSIPSALAWRRIRMYDPTLSFVSLRVQNLVKMLLYLLICKRSGFDSWRYQILGEVVGLEWGPLRLVTTMRSYLKEKVAPLV